MHDADARLSAGCIENRLKDIFTSIENEPKVNHDAKLEQWLREDNEISAAREAEIARKLLEIQTTVKVDITNEAWPNHRPALP